MCEVVAPPCTQLIHGVCESRPQRHLSDCAHNVYNACSRASMPRDLSLRTDSAGHYLRQIAEVHDWKQVATTLGSDIDQLRMDLQAVMSSCAQQLVLPEVKVSNITQKPFQIVGSSLLMLAAAGPIFRRLAAAQNSQHRPPPPLLRPTMSSQATGTCNCCLT